VDWFTRHFRNNLLQSGGELNPRAIRAVVANHLRFKPSSEQDLRSYNVLQRISYSAVVFILFPLMISRITVTDSAKGIGDGLGSGSPADGYSWYAGI
jgi:thiosulfate reductase cytochrome b subunit